MKLVRYLITRFHYFPLFSQEYKIEIPAFLINFKTRNRAYGEMYKISKVQLVLFMIFDKENNK